MNYFTPKMKALIHRGFLVDMNQMTKYIAANI
jgi:hypothetical protein